MKVVVRPLARLVSLGLVLGLTVGAGTVAPLASAEPSASASSSPSASRSAPPSRPSASSTGPSRAASAGPARRSLSGDVTDENLKTTITSSPAAFSYDKNPTFEFSAPSSPGQHLQFACSLTQKDSSAPPQDDDCTPGSSSDGTVTTGQMSYPGLEPSGYYYEFTVQASDSDNSAVGPPTTYTWHVYTVWSPAHVAPRKGPTFNNPLGKEPAQRRNLTHVIETVRSMPGFKQPFETGAPCPTTADAAPSIIRVSLYSMTDGHFAAAMKNAALRCVSVQLLMNNHLSVYNDPAFRRLQRVLKWNVDKINFAKRCSYGCRGRGVLHTKMYMFDSQLPAGTPGATDIYDAVMFGSSNMTQNASRVQWNDLYTVPGKKALFDDFVTYFNLMKKDDGFRRNRDPYASVGAYRVTFWPVRPKSHDPEVAALRSIRCTNVGSAGYKGRTDVYINMHAWFGPRGHKFLERVRSLYSKGCRIHILYSFMAGDVFRALKRGTGSRMSVRRTIYSLDGDKYADVYSHFKNIAVSGNVDGHPGSRMVWTGSNNFTPDGDHFDELMVRIDSGSAFRAYRAQFRFISRRKSSATYARFYEPIGGGRAPKKNGEGLAGGPPTILSHDASVDRNGNPRVRD